MIVSHKWRYIFVKNRKTAGTSVEIALSQYCGSDDIVTRIMAEDEVVRRELGGLGPQNDRVPIWSYGVRDFARLILKGKGKLAFGNHSPAGHIRQMLGAETWDSYHTFSIERNPWDRVISVYYWRGWGKEGRPLTDFLRSNIYRKFVADALGIYMDGNEPLIDRVLKFEALEEELEQQRLLIGLPEPLKLPRTKTGTRKDRRHYSEVLSNEERDIIGRDFKPIIDLMGYEF